MKNILSYGTNKPVCGKEIKDWIKYHTKNETEYTKEARKMAKYLNISDSDNYLIFKGDYQASNRQFCVQKVIKEGK